MISPAIRFCIAMTLPFLLLCSLQVRAFGDQFGDLETTEFLAVEQAYQLQLEASSSSAVDELTFIWLLQEGYFLYHHGFAVEWHAGDQQLYSRTAKALPLPAGIKKDDEYFGEVEIYYQQLAYSLPLADMPGSSLYVKASSQGCADAGLCYPPYHLYFSVNRMGAEGLSIASITAEQYAQAQQGSSALSGGASLAQSDSRTVSVHSAAINEIDSIAKWLLVLLSAFIGGLILNLMPCVLPILSIKVMQLARQHDTASARRQGVAYLVGVVLSFMAIAALMLLVRESGHAVGWGFQLQNPLFVAALVYLFFALGLGMSGFVAFGQRWMGAGQALTERSGIQGAFYTGVLAVVVASPCTAPFMGGALGYALTEPAYIVLTIFAALGLGMALPISLVSFIPAASALLPKPGLWMERLKQFFAFPLYATAVWLLWVLGNQTSTSAMAMMLLGCTLMGFGFWCFKSHKNSSRVAGLAAFIVVFMLPFSAAMTSKADQQLQGNHVEFTRETLDELRSQGVPVFIDLTADWCITCIANEQTTLQTVDVQKAFADAGIVYMVGDWTYPNPEITALLSEYHRSGIPLYLLYPPIPDAPAIILPQVLSRGVVLDAIEAIK